MRLGLFTIFFCVLFITCKNTDNKKDSTNPNTPEDTTILNTQAVDTLPENFYKRYEGRIAGKAVVLHYSKYKEEQFLTYYYLNNGIPISLYFNPEGILSSDSIMFSEYNALERNENPDEAATWHVLITPKGIAGKWFSANGKKVFDISLKENYTAGSHLFNIAGFSDKYEISLKKDTVAATSSMMLPEPSDAAAKWFIEALTKNIWQNEAETSLSLAQMMEADTKSFFKDYQSEIDTLIASRNYNDNDTYSFMNYESRLNANAIYNDNDFLVLNVGSYYYSGGAHGLEGSHLLCFDMQEKKVMQLTDIINIDSASIQKIIEKNFRKQHALTPKMPLTSILFDNKLPANDNFYFTNKGLGFVYQPYEVAAYVYGIIYVFIPFADVAPFINPQFAQRIGI